MKKWFGSLLLAACLSMMLQPPSYALAEELELESASVVLMEATSGKILYDKEMDEQRIPASVTKLMTLLVANEAIEQGRGHLDDVVVASEHAASLGGSQIYLEPGEEMTLQDLLVAIAVGSANDACVAVAEHLYGSEEAFVAEMNRRAESLGMVNTHFCNPYGLPVEGHHTSAHDLALLGQEALSNENVMKLTSIKHYTLRGSTSKPFELHNTNKLLWWYPGADGFKTGWVGPNSGYCLAATAQKDDMRLIAVVLGAQERYGNFRDAMKLFNYGFANYGYTPLFSKQAALQTLPVEKGQAASVSVGLLEDAGLVRAKQDQTELTTQYQLPSALTAPLQTGQIIGTVEVLEGEEVIASYDVAILQDVEKCGLLEQCKRVCQYMFSLSQRF